MESQVVTPLDFTSGFYNTIGGVLRKTAGSRRGINPATEEPNPDVPVSTPRDVDDAVAAARSAFEPWSRQSYNVRRKLIERFSDAVESHLEDFSKLLTREQGKPVSKLPWSDRLFTNLT